MCTVLGASELNQSMFLDWFGVCVHERRGAWDYHPVHYRHLGPRIGGETEISFGEPNLLGDRPLLQSLADSTVAKHLTCDSQTPYSRD